MSAAKHSDQGCLSVLSSCFKSRDKRQPVDAGTSRPTSNVIAANGAVPLSATPAQQRDQTSQATGVGASEPAEPKGSTSTVIDKKAVSTAPGPDEAFLLKQDSEGSLNLWQEAYKAAEEDTQKWIREHIGEWSESANPFSELVNLVRSSEDNCDQKAWQLEFRGRAVLLTDYTSRVTSCLTTIGDIAINFAPAPSPIIWNALKVVLKANVSQVEDRASIMGCTNLVLCLVRRGIIYQEVYLGDYSSSTTHDDLKETLIDVYRTCLEFLAFVHEQLRQGNMHRLFHELMEPGQGEKRVSDVKALEQQLDTAARACEFVANRDRSNEHKELLRSLQLPLKRIDDTVIHVLSRLEENEKRQVKAYLSTIPVGSHHYEKSSSRTEGTCEWLVDHPKFREWEDSSCSSIFWLQGSMGTGKSYLSSKIIDRYRVPEEERGGFASRHDEGFAFFYCYRSDPSRRSTRSILQSYIRQLGSVPRRPDHIHQALVDLYKSGQNIQHDLTLTKCKDTLIEIINSYPRVTLALDALDECTDEARRELAELFQELVEKSKGLVRIFIASRKELDIEGYLRPSSGRQLLVSISTLDNASDIERFITHEIKGFQGWNHIEENTKLFVKDTLVEKSDGMFQWTYLQWQYLKDAYNEIYHRPELDEDERLMLQRTVRWVLYAKRPLDTVTLLAAIQAESERLEVFEGKGKAYAKPDLTEGTLQSICRDLVVKDPQLDTWGFPHASVAEYFLLKHEPWIDNGRAETTIAITHFLIDCCAAFGSVWPPPTVMKELEQGRDLSFYLATADVNLDERLDPRHPLQQYTRREWPQHFNDISDNEPMLADVVQALKQFLGEKGPRESSPEYRVFCKYLIPNPFPIYRRMVEPLADSRFGIIALGLTRFLPGWWDKDLDPSETNADGHDMLTLAAQSGQVYVCEDLICRGFNMNKKINHWDQSALGQAIFRRHIDITRLLLDNGADPDLATESSSLLCLATLRGLEYLQAMLHAGANPDILCDLTCPCGCALSMAAHAGSSSSIEVLLEAGADLHPRFVFNRHQSPLATAVEEARSLQVIEDCIWLRCTRLLLDRGANPNEITKPQRGLQRYETILEMSVAKGFPELTRLLVEYGAYIETPLRLQGYDTILEYAVEKGNVDFAQFLISHGADVHSKLRIGGYGSLLAAATLAPDSSLDMVKFLVEDAHVDLAQLEWRLVPEDTTPGESSSTSSSSSSLQAPPIRGEELSEKQQRSRAERAEYLLRVHKVDRQVLDDLKSQY